MFRPETIAFYSVLLVIIIVAAYLLLERYLKQQERNWMFQLKADNNKAFAPLRISAYERIIVMLERITPSSLVLRHNVSSLSAGMLQLEMIRAIREEFEHNISLQMYVSDYTWQQVKKGKEEVLDLIKMAFTKVKPESPGLELSREIFRLEVATGNSGVKAAIRAIREELLRHFQ